MPIDWPIQPTANSRIALAIETKMSLKLVIEAELLLVDRGACAAAVEEIAKRGGGVGVERARGDGLVEVLVAVHDNSPLSAEASHRVYYHVNTVGGRDGRRRSGG